MRGRQLLCILFVFAGAALAGCGGDGALEVRLEGTQQALGGWLPDEVVELRISVDAEDMDIAVSERFFSPEEGATYVLSGIPAGEERLVTVTLLDIHENVLIYGTKKGVTVKASSTSAVEVPLKYAPLPGKLLPAGGGREGSGDEYQKDSGSGVLINGGAVFTTVRGVTLTLEAATAIEMFVEDCGGQPAEAPIPYQTEYTCDLPDVEDGIREVFVRFVDADGYTSATVSDTIILDTAGPTNAEVIFQVAGEHGGGKSTRSPRLSAYLFGGGADKMWLASVPPKENASPAPDRVFAPGGLDELLFDEWQEYRPEVEVELGGIPGKYALYVRLADRAGWETEYLFDVVELLAPEVATALVSQVELPVGCAPPGGEYAGWAIPGGILDIVGSIVAGEPDVLPTINSARLEWCWPETTVCDGKDLPAAEFTVEADGKGDFLLAGQVDTPDIPDGRVLSFIVQIEAEFGDVSVFSEAKFSPALLVDSQAPASLPCELLDEVVGIDQGVLVVETGDGDLGPGEACSVSIVVDGEAVAGARQPLLEGVNVLSFSLAGFTDEGSTDAQSFEIGARLRDAAGNFSDSPCGQLLYKPGQPQMEDFVLFVPDPASAEQVVRPGSPVAFSLRTDASYLFDSVLEFDLGGGNHEQQPVEIAYALEDAPADGGFPFLVSGEFLVPQHSQPAQEGFAFQLSVKAGGSWGVSTADPWLSGKMAYDDRAPELWGAWLNDGDSLCVASPTPDLYLDTSESHYWLRLSGAVEGGQTAWFDSTDESLQPFLPFPVQLEAEVSGLAAFSVEVADPAGNVSTLNLDFYLDVEPPLLTLLAPDLPHPSLTPVTEGHYVLNSLSMPIQLAGFDQAPCPPLLVHFEPDPAFAAGLAEYGPPVSIDEANHVVLADGPDGPRGFCAVAVDSTGNESAPLCLAAEGTLLTLDRQAPVAPVITLGAQTQHLNAIIDSCDIGIDVHAQHLDTDAGADHEIRVSLAGDVETIDGVAVGSESVWYLLNDPDIPDGYWTHYQLGLKADKCVHGSTPVVLAQFKDLAGNETDTASLPLIMNTAPPQTPALMGEQCIVVGEKSLTIVRSDAQDEDFKTVSPSVCLWNYDGAPPPTSCNAQGNSTLKNVSFDLDLFEGKPGKKVTDADYRACIRAVDYFGETGEAECLSVSLDTTAPVSSLECSGYLDVEGQGDADKRWPCGGGRARRHQQFIGVPHDRNPGLLHTIVAGVAGLPPAEAFDYQGGAFTLDSEAPITLSSMDSVGNKEIARRFNFSFEFDHVDVDLGLGSFWGATVTPLLNGDLLVIGGSPGKGPTRDTFGILPGDDLSVDPEEYDPVEYSRRIGNNELAHSEFHTAVRLPDGRVAVVGGIRRASPDTPASQWELVTGVRLFDALGNPDQTLAVPLARVHHTAVVAKNKLVISGGFGLSTSDVETMEADPDAVVVPRVLDDIVIVDLDSWQHAVQPNQSGPRMLHTATTLPDGMILLAGGFDANSVATSSIEIVDPDSGASFLPPAGVSMTARGYHSATMLANGNIMLAGGIPEVDLEDPFSIFMVQVLTSVVLVGPDGSVLKETKGVLEGGQFHSATLLSDGNVLFAGGFGALGVIDHAVLVSEDGMPGTYIAGIGGGRVGHGTQLLADDRVALLGGALHPLQTVYDNAIVLQRDVGLSYLGEVEETKRFLHTSTLLPDGNLLMVGGFGSGGNLDSAVVLSPAGDVKKTVPNSAFRRSRHMAVLLPGGNVLIIGGSVINFDDIAEGKFETVPTAAVVSPEGEVLQGPFANPAFGRLETTALLIDVDRVLMMGGSDSQEAGNKFDDAVVFELDGGSVLRTDGDGTPITHVMPLPFAPARSRHTTTLLDDGRLLVAGGISGANYASSLNEAVVVSLAADNTILLENTVPDIGGPRSEHAASIMGAGNVLISGGNDPGGGLDYGVILSGRGDSAGQVVNANVDTGGTRATLHRQVTLMNGDALIWGGDLGDDYYPHAIPNDTAIIVAPDGATVRTLHFPGHGAWKQSLNLLPDGSVLAMGGSIGSTYTAADAGQIATGDRIRFAALGQTIAVGDLWYGATVNGTTGPWSPYRTTGANQHVPNPQCTSGKSQDGPDRAYRLMVRQEERFVFKAIPEPGFDLSLYVIMMHTERNGHLCFAGVDDNGPGEEEILFFDAEELALPRSGPYYVVVDSSDEGASGSYTLGVYKNLAEMEADNACLK